MSENKKDTFTLICLGTATTFNPKDNYLVDQVGPDIKLQQTLSTVASHILPNLAQQPAILLQAQEMTARQSVTVINNQVVVLDGPDVAGIVVHDLIAKGLIAVLNALLQGVKVINIVGFSRGAVESIHILHELQRIKQALCEQTPQNEVDLVKIICAANTQWSTTHLHTYHKPHLLKVLTSDHIRILAEWFTAETQALNAFLLDPVPGLGEGSILGFAAWVSAQHYVIPKIVARCVVIYHEDERSSGFRPVWVATEPEAATILKRLNLPGAHGTGDGNPFHHDPKKAKNDGMDPNKTRDVQTLVFYSILQFLEDNGVGLCASGTQYYLDTFYEQFSAATTIEARNKLFYDVYERIAAYRDQYRKFQQTAYTSLEDYRGERWIMQQKGPTYFSDCLDMQPDIYFINNDHFLLALNMVLHSNCTMTNRPDHCQLTMKIKNFLDQLEADSDALQKLFTVIQNNQTKKELVDKLVSSASDKLARYYFSDQVNRIEKEELAATINRLLSFQFFTDTDEARVTVLRGLQANMQRNMTDQVQRLLNEYDSFITTNWSASQVVLQERIEEKQNPQDLSTAEHEICPLIINRSLAYYQVLSNFLYDFPKLDQAKRVKEKALVLPLQVARILHSEKYVIAEQENSLFWKEVIRYYDVFLGDQAPRILELRKQFESQYETQAQEITACKTQLGQLTTDLANEQNKAKCLKEELKQRINSANFPPGCLDGINFQIVSGIIMVLGIVAVSLALTALMLGSSGLLLPSATIVGGGLLSMIGSYGLRHGINMVRQQEFAQYVRSL